MSFKTESISLFFLVGAVFLFVGVGFLFVELAYAATGTKSPTAGAGKSSKQEAPTEPQRDTDFRGAS